jgi:hypothetical protein
MAKSVKVLKRGEVIDPTPIEGNLVRVKKPTFLSLVGLPANQTGFKVVRSDQGENKMSTTTSRRLRRSETNPVLRLTFPEGTTEESVQATLESFKMQSYTVAEEAGVFTAIRSDVKSISEVADTHEIKLTAGGLMATVKRSESKPVQPIDATEVAVVGIEFDATLFDTQHASEWLKRNCVDKASEPAQNSDESLLVVTRGEAEEGQEVRRVAVEDGVTAVIARSDVSSIPDGMYAVVSETAYGSWGWGQLDFNAALADSAFTEAMWDSLYTLRDVLEQVVIYSPLPVETRKALVLNALAQYGAYVVSVMDSLPRQLLVTVARSAQPKQENEMNKQAENQATGANEPKTEFVTRSELAAAVAEGIKAADAAKQAELKRSADEEAQAKAKAEADDKAKEVLRSDITAAVEAATKPLTDEIEKLKGATVVRSDSGDTVVKQGEGKGKATDVFRGCLPGIRRQAAGQSNEVTE